MSKRIKILYIHSVFQSLFLLYENLKVFSTDLIEIEFHQNNTAQSRECVPFDIVKIAVCLSIPKPSQLNRLTK